jgi:Amt family ammonium transporter
MTFVLLKAIALFAPLRVSAGDEALGLDIVSHGEEAYPSGEGAILVPVFPAREEAAASRVAPAPATP